ncbi:MAG: Holliday junction branch migration protein RuvA, partial [Acholeplasmataceae bacterium]
NPYAYKLEEHALVHTHHYVREDVDHLYGFQRPESKELFIALIGVPGIGPKSALSILATDAIDDIRYAIASGNAKYLTNFPGIGNKSAQQIILDLKGKLSDVDEDVSLETNDVQDALLALGYSKTEVKRVLKKIDRDQSVEMMVKSALRLLIK